MHPCNLPEPLSDKSTFVLLDLTALFDLCVVNHFRFNNELVIRSGHLAISLPPSFRSLFHLRRVHRLRPVFYSDDMSLAIVSGVSTFCKAIDPPPWHTNALFSSPSSLTSLIVRQKKLWRCSFDSTCVHPSTLRVG